MKITKTNHFYYTGIVILALLAISFSAGCSHHPDKVISCQNQLLKTKEENQQLKTQLVNLQQELNARSKQINTLQEFGPDRLKSMVVLDRIKLDRLTGGYDSDKDGYDDGIVVYLQPVDTDGHIVKVAGKLCVKLFTLDENPGLIGQIELAPEDVKKNWIGRLWTDHYTIRCPFQTRPDKPDVTLQVEFTELLTGNTFLAQKLCKIKIPQTTKPRP